MVPLCSSSAEHEATGASGRKPCCTTLPVVRMATHLYWSSLRSRWQPLRRNPGRWNHGKCFPPAGVWDGLESYLEKPQRQWSLVFLFSESELVLARGNALPQMGVGVFLC